MEIVTAKLPAKEAIRKAVEKKIGKFGKSDIMELWPSLSGSSIEASLKSLCAEGFIEKRGGGIITIHGGYWPIVPRCWTWLLSETCLNVSIIASYSGQWVYGIKLGLDIPFFNVDNEEVLYGILEVVEALADAASESNGGGSRRYGRHRR